MIRSLKTLGLIGAASACAMIGAAHAAVDKDSMLEKAFGSTILSTYPDGRQAELWLERDGSYTAIGRRKDHSSGRWTVKDDKLCLRQQKPIAAPFSFCTAVPAEGIEKPWIGRAWTGEQINIKLIQGVHGHDETPRKAAGDGKDDKAKDDRG